MENAVKTKSLSGRTELAETRVFGLKAEIGRWLYVIIGLCFQLCLGAVYAWSSFKKPIMSYFDLNATEGSIPFIVFLACFAAMMPFGGRLIQKYGPKIIGVAGGIMVGVGWFLSSFAPNLAVLTITYGVIAGIGVGLAYGVPIQTSTRWFPDRKGLAVGLTVGGFGLSAALISPIGNSLITSHDVTFMFKVFGLTFLAITVLLSLLQKFPVNGWKPAGWKGANSGIKAVVDATPSQMVKTKSFVVLFLCFLFGSTAGLMAIGISSPVGQEVVQLSAATSASLVGVFAVFNFGGRPIFGWLTDRINPRNAAAVNFILISLGSAGMLFLAGPGTTVIYVISFALLWMALGGWLAIAPTTTTTYFGLSHNATNYGIVFIAYGLGAIVGNLISGRAKDLFGNYDVAFLVTLVLAVLGIVLCLTFLKPPRHQEKVITSGK